MIDASQKIRTNEELRYIEKRIEELENVKKVTILNITLLDKE